MILFALLIFFPILLLVWVYLKSVVPALIKKRFLFLFPLAKKFEKKYPKLAEKVEDILIDIEVRFPKSEKKYLNMYVKTESETFIDLIRSYWFFWTLLGCILCWIILKMTESYEVGTSMEVWPITWEFVHMDHSFWIMIVLIVALKLALNRIKIPSEFETDQNRYRMCMDLLPDEEDDE